MGSLHTFPVASASALELNHSFIESSANSWVCLTDVSDPSTPRRSRSRSNSDKEKRIPNRILLLGRIRELALYRAEVLSSHGYRVLTPHTKEESIRAIRSGNYDVAILTYTLPSDLVEEFAQLIREYCPTCPVIAITDAQRQDRRISPNATVLADDGPAALIAALRRVIRKH